ncbi:alcohol dehydrogenase catalytic domain-containing protein, partial [Micromonospora musae]|uniref:alcohol dehydrogenase catalytic domain-containing protein n=1 Tax=Micromonospora musae TaxID=1894970 RepID=UPI0033EF4224
MKATAWMGRDSVKVVDVPDPTILSPRDAIVRISTTAICGSDMHLYHGYIPAMRKGDILGHEFMGEVVEVGPQVRNLRPGDRVVVPFPIACGHCISCQRGLYSVCENSNPNAGIAEKILGHSPAGIFGYSHLLGGYAGGQAEYARVPFADVGPLKLPDEVPDEQAVMLADVFPTGYMGAEMCDIKPGQLVAVWGAGPVGLLAAASARLLGAERVFVIDRYPYRLRLAREHAGAETINYEESDVLDTLNELTAGRGPDACIDAVGLEGHHGNAAIYAYDRVKQGI